MDVELVASFIWDRNPLLQKSTTFDKVVDWLKNQRSVIIRKGNKIMAVGLYLIDRKHIHCHFISLTARKGLVKGRTLRQSFAEVVRKDHPKFISWLNPDFDLITVEV